MKFKKVRNSIAAILAALTLTVSAYSPIVNVPVSAHAESIVAESETIEKASFAPLTEYWTEGSAAAASISDYVQMVTDPASENFIPVEDRIAVFDLDGTVVGELYPSYFDWVMFVHRALYDDTYEAPEEMKEFAHQLEDAWYNGAALPKDAEKTHARMAAESYKGMTIDEFKDYCREFGQSKAEGFKHLKRIDAFYKPMVSLIEFLQANDFTVYIVSGTDRNCVRVIIEDVLDIPENNVIGSDINIIARRQGDTDGLDFVYSPDDELVLGGELMVKDVKMNKVSAIAREIGKVPVLGFGNTSGDYSMLQYVVNNDKYETRSYMVLCDDLKREHGNMDKANSVAEYSAEHGFETISMRDDFATIYGDKVKITKKYR